MRLLNDQTFPGVDEVSGLTRAILEVVDVR